VARYRLRLLLQEFDLPQGETVLGRSPECQVTIDDPLVSREHAKILVQNDTVICRDLGSRNGSKVNGVPLRGEIPLNDGDRIRIGNQEIVFTKVVVPRRPGRPTGSLRHCQKCQTPYVAEAPQCPNCGYAPGAEDTLSGAPRPGNLDREAWSLQMQMELLERALTLGRTTDADRVMGRMAIAIDERLAQGMSVDPPKLLPTLIGAVRLAAAQGEAQWLRWAFGLLQKAECPPNRELAEAVGRVPPIVLEACEGIHEVVASFDPSKLDEPARAALEMLAASVAKVGAKKGES